MHGVGLDSVLTHEQVLDFRDGLIWPAVNHLGGRDFVEEALAGEGNRWQVTRFTPQGLLRCTLAVECTAVTIDEDCFDGDEAAGDFEIAVESTMDCDATLTIEKSRPDMLEALITVALNPNGDEELDEDEASMFRAWRADSYRFSTFNGCPIDVKNDRYLLEDESGSEFWSTDEMAARQEEKPTAPDDREGDGVQLSPDDLKVLTEMKVQRDTSLTVAACHEIADALAMLGAPAGKLALSKLVPPGQ